jgi:hypothetical protein
MAKARNEALTRQKVEISMPPGMVMWNSLKTIPATMNKPMKKIEAAAPTPQPSYNF